MRDAEARCGAIVSGRRRRRAETARERNARSAGAREVTLVVTSSLGAGAEGRHGTERLWVETELGVAGVELTAYHGVHEEERRCGRRFRVDVHVKGDWSGATRTDKLGDSLDYERIVQRIRTVSQERSYHLIEAFAAAIADDVLQSLPGILEVRVCVRKLAFSEWGPEACASAVVTKRLARSAA